MGSHSGSVGAMDVRLVSAVVLEGGSVDNAAAMLSMSVVEKGESLSGVTTVTRLRCDPTRSASYGSKANSPRSYGSSIKEIRTDLRGERWYQIEHGPSPSGDGSYPVSSQDSTISRSLATRTTPFSAGKLRCPLLRHRVNSSPVQPSTETSRCGHLLERVSRNWVIGAPACPGETNTESYPVNDILRIAPPDGPGPASPPRSPYPPGRW